MRNQLRRKLLIPLSLIILTVGGIYLAYFLNPRGRGPLHFELEQVGLEGHQRLMVFAPHCDDEVLGAGGLIQLAIAQHMDVIVVIETNGDGYLFATMEEFRRMYPRPQDYIRMGSLRQQETLAALRTLGLQEDQVVFLGYPDRGTPNLWTTNWSTDTPYTSPYTRTYRSPYPLTFDPDAVYAGQKLLENIRTLLEIYRPDLIVFPHPSDVHPDHWGLSAFIRLAVYLMQREHGDYQPTMLSYLVHRPDFPWPKGYLPYDDLLPPLKLWSVDTEWLRIDLPEEVIMKKEQAILEYKSQLPFLRKLMMGFVRTNELFDEPVPASLEEITAGSPTQPISWKTDDGEEVLPIQEDAVGDFITRKLIPATDLLSIYAGRTTQNTLWMCGMVRGKPNPFFTYSLNLVAIDGQGVVHHTSRNRNLRPGMSKLTLQGSAFCDEIDLSTMGNPWLLLMSADVRNGTLGILDQTAWQAVFMESSHSGSE